MSGHCGPDRRRAGRPANHHVVLSWRSARPLLALLFGATVLGLVGSAGAAPVTSWSTASAGTQTLAGYQGLSVSQRSTALYTTTAATTPTPGGTPIYNYSDWSTTGPTNAAFESAANDVLTQAKIAGRYLPPLRTLATFNLGATPFDIGWRFTIGGVNWWSEVFGDADSKRYDNGTGPFPQVSLLKWDYKASGVGNGFTAPGWYGRFNITSNTSYCQGYAGSGTYVVPTGTSLSVNGSGCSFRQYYSDWKLMQDNPAITSAMGSFQTHTSPCPTFYEGGGTSGTTGCGVVYRSEDDMLARVRVTAPATYTSQTAPGGTTNTGTYTRPGDQGGGSDLTASEALLFPSSPTWSSLTAKQKAALTALFLRANSGFAPVDDYQTMPNCVGLAQSGCDAALDAVGATGTRTYDVAGFDDVDLTRSAGDVITQATSSGSSFARTSNLTFMKNPSPLPLLLRWAPELRYDSLESYRADSAREITDSYVDGEYSNVLWDQDNIVIAASDPSDPSPTLSLDHLGSYQSFSSHKLREHPGTIFDDASRLHASVGGGYADKIYGRVVVDGGITWLQYWFFYYYNPKTFVGFGNHEGDWEMMQIALDENDEPSLAAYSQHESGEACDWTYVTKNSNGHPVVYVAEGSHSNYFFADTDYPVVVGDVSVGTDSADGQGGMKLPAVVDITTAPAWTAWPGKWGASDNSPSSLPSHTAWSDPLIWFYDGTSSCRQLPGLRIAGAGVTGRRSSTSSATPPTPAVSASIQGKRAVIKYAFASFPATPQRPWTLLTTIVPSGARYLPYTIRTRITARTGRVVQKLPAGPAPYRLRFAALTRAGVRGVVRTIPLR